MNTLGTFHLLAAGLALGAGASVAIARKGTLRHRWTGRVYLFAMLMLNVSALALYRLTGSFNLFHFFALVSLATLLAGWLPAWRKRGEWKPWHARFMMWSYAGLLMAAVSEIATRLPFVHGWTRFGIAVGVATTVVAAISAFYIERAARPLDGRKINLENVQ